MRKIFVLLLCLPACGESSVGGVTPLTSPIRLTALGTATGMLQMQLQGMTGLPSQPGPANPAVDVDARGIAHAATLAPEGTNALSFAIDSSTLALDLRSGQGRLDAFDFPIGDLRLFASWLPSGGLELRQLALRLADGARLDVERAQPDSVTLSGTVDLELDWDLELADHSLYALGPLPLDPIDVRLGILRGDDGTVSLQIYGTCESCGGIESVLTFSNGLLFAIVPMSLQAL